MRKLAFENAVSGFEMPSFRMVGLEKENSNIQFATPKTVYKGGTSSFSRSQLLAAALGADDEEVLTGLSAFNPEEVAAEVTE